MKTFYSLDIGNSHPHVGHFEAGKLAGVYSWGNFLKQMNGPAFSSHYSYAASIVGKRPQELDHLKGEFIDLRSHWRGPHFFGMPMSYAATLGDDRLFSCAHIWQELKTQGNENALLIDAGTFITFDWINVNDGHLGGVICPGLATYLHNYARGEQLTHYAPAEISWENKVSIPLDTKSAILTGAQWYFESLILKASGQRQVEKIYLTGGSSEVVGKILATQTKAKLIERPHLIHEAMSALAMTTFN